MYINRRKAEEEGKKREKRGRIRWKKKKYAEEESGELIKGADASEGP